MAAATTTNPGARATGRYLPVSPYKVRQVLELVRGLPVDDAERVLQLCEKDAADHVLKLLHSAVANAENNHGLDVNDLVVKEAYVGKNLVLTRFHARGRGRMSPIEKPFAQLTVVVKAQEEEAQEGGA